MMIGFFYFLGEFQPLEQYYFVLLGMSSILLIVCLFVDIEHDRSDELWSKKLPAKIQLPLSQALIFKIEYSLGFILFLFAIFSIAVTWVLWLICFCLSLIWVAFFHHPHVWAKDSIDIQDRISHPEKYKVNYEDGCFEYLEDGEGFIYQPDDQTRAIKIKWSDIHSVDAQFVDMYSHTEIQLYILAEDRILRILESTDGYLKFYQQLQDHLKDFDDLKMLVYLSGEFSEPINVYKKI